jgi:hypothetical protein
MWPEAKNTWWYFYFRRSARLITCLPPESGEN